MAEGIVIPISVRDNGATQTLGNIGRSVQNLEQIVGAQALMGFAQTLAGWALEGDRATDVLGAMALDMGGLQRATAGTVDAMTLASAANRAMAAGLNLSQRELEAVVAAGANYARVIGVDASVGTDRLVSALATGTQRGLRPFGIQADNTSDAIRALTGRLGENESALRRNSGALDRTAAQVADLKTGFQQLASDGVETFLNAVGLIGSRTEEQMGRALAAAETFAQRFNRIAVRIGTALGFTEGMTSEQASQWAGTAEGVAAFRQRGFRSRREIDLFIANTQRTGGNVREALGRIPLSAQGQMEAADAQRSSDEASAQADWQAQEARFYAGRGGDADEAPARRRGGGGGGGGGRRGDSERDALADARARDAEWAAAWGEDYEDAQARRVGGPEQLRRNLTTGRGRSANDGPNRAAGSGERNQIRNLSALERAYEQLGSTATSVLDAMGEATSRHFEAWALGRETMGEALAGMTADLFKWMGQQALKKAGMEAVEAIAAAARYDFGGAALHAAAAAGFAALAGGSFYVSGQVGGGGRPTHGRDEVGRSSTRDLGSRDLGGQGQAGPTVVINVSPGGIIGPNASELLGRIAVNGINEGIRRGGFPRIDGDAMRGRAA